MRWIGIAAVFFVLLGCGANLSIELPNDHILAVANSNDVTIVSKHQFGNVVKASVGDLDTEGDFVFGEIVEPDTQLLNEYFVLDTATSSTEYYATKTEWEAALAQLGIAEVELRGPSAYFNWHDQIWWRIVLFVMAVLAITIPVWLIRRARKKELELHLIRQNQPEGFDWSETPIDDAGGVNNLDNKRNEIAPEKWEDIKDD